MARGGFDWSVEDAYSSKAPNPTFIFVVVYVALHSNLCVWGGWRCMISFNTLTSTIDICSQNVDMPFYFQPRMLMIFILVNCNFDRH
jgi:hypothetical protein